jgi:Ion channel
VPGGHGAHAVRLSWGLVAAGAVGGVLLLVTLADVFVTVFNYDGLTFLTARLHRLAWHTARTLGGLLPPAGRNTWLSVASAALLPATVAGWLALETTAFALMYLPGLAGGSFRLSHHLGPGAGTAFYFSAGDITSLTFGDVVPVSGIFRALAVLETAIGLATISLAVAYVLAALDALGSLNKLHGRVRRQATRPNRPATIVARYFRSGQADEISGLLDSFAEDLEGYDQGLRRYPVVFYFHTRRAERSIPSVFMALGDLIELIRWGASCQSAHHGQPLSAGPHRRVLHHAAPAAAQLRRATARPGSGAAAGSGVLAAVPRATAHRLIGGHVPVAGGGGRRSRRARGGRRLAGRRGLRPVPRMAAVPLPPAHVPRPGQPGARLPGRLDLVPGRSTGATVGKPMESCVGA